MVSNIRLLHIHKRFCEIFGCPDSPTFADLSIIVVAELLQLSPITSLQIFEKCGEFFQFVITVLNETTH